MYVNFCRNFIIVVIQEDDSKAKASYHLESKLAKDCDAILTRLAKSDLDYFDEKKESASDKD
jgi:hypothetical protein